MPGEGQPFFPAEPIVYLTITISMLALRLPRRRGFAWRALAGVALVWAAAGVATALCLAFGMSEVGFTGRELIIFSSVMLAFALAILLAFEASVPAALFCATTGYAMQNLGSGLVNMLQMVLFDGRESLTTELLSPLMVAVVTGVCYVTFGRKISSDALSELDDWPMLLMFLTVAFIVIGLDIVFKNISNSISNTYTVFLRISHAAICLFVIVTECEILFLQKLRAEQAVSERLAVERQRQYDVIRNSIDAVNIKCHDLRHQMSLVGKDLGSCDLEGFVDDVNIYDARIETGNEVLDTILTEKSLVCETRGIHLTCIADGSALDFMAASDICALFGNAFDNAIEAVSLIEDEQMRSISLVVKRRGSMVSLHMENYCAHEPVFENGLPQTTKEDTTLHGFGTRSMRLIVEKYAGSLVLSCEKGTFSLDAVVPVPDVAA